MKPIFTIFAFFTAASLALAQETPVTSTLKSVGLFKNGVVVVREEISVPGGGRYLLEQVPTPIHGTFFLESDAVVETTVTRRSVTEPLDEGQTLDFQKDFAGQKITVHFSGDVKETVSGTVVAIPEADPNRMIGRSRSYRRSEYTEYADDEFTSLPSAPMAYPSFRPAFSSDQQLILETEKGGAFLTGSSILWIDTDKKIDKIVRKRNVMIFDVKSEKPAKIALFYLTKGITWVPTYRIDMTDPKRLTVEQTAVVVNELRELKNTEVALISGFPKIECENVDAPFSPGASLAGFFQQLASRSRGRSSSVMTQQAIMYNPVSPRDAGDDTAGLSAEGPDIHLQKIGKKSMSIGDSLFLTNGKGTADYERVVEWTVPDTRDAWGRYVDRGGKEDADPWDMLRFRNPLSFPMTTAPATIVANNAFYAQNTSFWAGPGEMTKIPVTKSMSVRVKSTESERVDESKRGVPAGDFDDEDGMFEAPGMYNQSPFPAPVSKPVYPTFSGNQSIQQTAQVKGQYAKIDNYTYRKATIDAELTIVNRRAEPVKMLVSRRISGELESQIKGATVRALNEDLSSVNRKYELQWEFTLASGETKKLTYSYVVLIRN